MAAMTLPTSAMQAGLMTLSLVAILPGQEYVRWLADLGDQQSSEAAERALVAMGKAAVVPLGKQLEAWDWVTPRERERCRALLRVMNLLGRDAAVLAPYLKRDLLQQAGKDQPLITNTMASLEPYAKGIAWHELFHLVARKPDDRGKSFACFIRLQSRQASYGGKDVDTEDFSTHAVVLAKDEFGAREVAAEAMGRLGNLEAVPLLQRRLLDRNTPAKGWDQLRHNGFLVPIEDQFALCAGLALTKLAPTDQRAAIGYANVAIHHPHASVRLEALRQMGQLGPAAADAIPELMTIAKQDDRALAIEALKLLGMAGKAVGNHLREIDDIAAADDGVTARIAKSLAARLRAMGCEVDDSDAASNTQREQLMDLVRSLDANSDSTAVAKVAAEPTAWPLLCARLQQEEDKAPDAVFDALAQLGWQMPEDDRNQMRYCIAQLGSQNWEASMMSSSSGTGKIRTKQHETYARLQVDPKADPQQLVAQLEDQNPYVRLVALEFLLQHVKSWSQPGSEHDAVVAALLHAATEEHPQQFTIDQGRHNRQTVTVRNSKLVNTAAAEALAATDLRSDKLAALLAAVVRSTNELLVVSALQHWSSGEGQDLLALRSQLEAITKNTRQAVAAEAWAALERLPPK